MNIILEFSEYNSQHKQLQKWVENASQQDILHALIIGHTIITSDINNQSSKLLLQKEEEHNAAIKKVISQYEGQIQLLHQQHSRDIEHYRQQCHQFMSKYDLLDQKEREITQLKAQLTSVQNTNSYKGEVGETTIRTILQDTFIGYEIKDTSAQASASDIHIIDKDGYFVAIECKNKATISTQDVTKSLNDIKTLKANSDKFIGYLFISMRSLNIPKKGDLLYETIDNIPTIWYGATADDKSLPNDIIKLVRLLFNHYGFQPDQNDLIDGINTYFQKLQEMKRNITNSLNTINIMKHQLTTVQESTQWIYDDISRLLQSKSTCYKCPSCEMEYKRKGDLNRHIIAKHTPIH